MPTSKQRRQAAQRHLQKQLERRAELAKKRRRNLSIVATVVAVAVVVVAALVLTGVFSSDKSSSQAAGSGSSAATGSAAATTRSDGTIACTYSPDKSGNTHLKDVGTPPNAGKTPATGTVALKMSTTQGDIGLNLDRSKAPCAAASFAYLAQKKFFDGSPCHREVNEPNFGVLQCGDPTGTGQGGPTYKFAEEVSQNTTYPRGTIAMAKSSAPNSTGSQFFLCFTDTQLPPQYTVVGKVDDAGLTVLDKIAAAGNDGSFQSTAGGGAPKLPVTINAMTVQG